MPPADDMARPTDEDGTRSEPEIELHVRRMHRRDINRVWHFLKMVFRGVNR